MVVASGDQCGSGRRAQRSRVESVVAQAGIGESLEVGCRDRPAEGAACPEPDIVRQDKQDVGSPGRRFDTLWKIRSRVFDRPSDLAVKRRLGDGQDATL